MDRDTATIDPASVDRYAGGAGPHTTRKKEKGDNEKRRPSLARKGHHLCRRLWPLL